jgi:hypothetical protein
MALKSTWRKRILAQSKTADALPEPIQQFQNGTRATLPDVLEGILDYSPLSNERIWYPCLYSIGII